LTISKRGIICYSSGTLTDISTSWDNIDAIQASKGNLVILLKSPGNSTKRIFSALSERSIINQHMINLHDFMYYWDKGDLRSVLSEYLDQNQQIITQ
jgi:hypothetical protein